MQTGEPHIAHHRFISASGRLRGGCSLPIGFANYLTLNSLQVWPRASESLGGNASPPRAFRGAYIIDAGSRGTARPALRVPDTSLSHHLAGSMPHLRHPPQHGALSRRVESVRGSVRRADGVLGGVFRFFSSVSLKSLSRLSWDIAQPGSRRSAHGLKTLLTLHKALQTHLTVCHLMKHWKHVCRCTCIKQ